MKCWNLNVFLMALIPGLLLAFSTQAHADTHNMLTPAEKEAGWILLFDGKSTDAWRNYRKPDISTGWQVIDGAMVRQQKSAGDIITKDQFDAFELVLEYKLTEAGNSGLMYHVTEEAERPWQTGPEVQILDNPKGRDPQKSGWLYQLYPATEDATKPAGQWNEIRIIITPEKCEHYMNGVKYCEYVKGSDDWNKRVADSKFAQYEGFGKAQAGHISLQDHNDVVAFRNIKIRPIKTDSTK